MGQLDGLKAIQEQQRQEMRVRIEEAIQSMRAERTTITITTLAEELGVSRQSLYAEYIQRFLKNYREFNQSLPDIPDIETISELEKNLLVARSKLKEEKKKTKALRLEITVLKQQLQDANKQYEYLLGQYQVDVGNKIIHF